MEFRLQKQSSDMLFRKRLHETQLSQFKFHELNIYM